MKPPCAVNPEQHDSLRSVAPTTLDCADVERAPLRAKGRLGGFTSLIPHLAISATLGIAVGIAAVLVYQHFSDNDREPMCVVDGGNKTYTYPSRFALVVPQNYQAQNYTCGVTSLASVLQAYGFNVSEMSLAAECESNEDDGTLWSNLVNASVNRLLHVTASNNFTLPDLFQFIYDKRSCVIVDYQAYKYEDNNATWINDWIDGHYSVLIGWNETGILLMDPSQDEYQWGYIPTDEFLDRWHDIDGCCTPVVHLALKIWKPGTFLPLAEGGWPSINVSYTW